MSLINESHDPSLKSWVAQANEPGSDFPIQNLPFAVFRRKVWRDNLDERRATIKLRMSRQK
jgi:hypothetical protein